MCFPVSASDIAPFLAAHGRLTLLGTCAAGLAEGGLLLLTGRGMPLPSLCLLVLTLGLYPAAGWRWSGRRDGKLGPARALGLAAVPAVFWAAGMGLLFLLLGRNGDALPALIAAVSNLPAFGTALWMEFVCGGLLTGGGWDFWQFLPGVLLLTGFLPPALFYLGAFLRGKVVDNRKNCDTIAP